MSDCDAPVKARGWCRKHYLRWYKTGDPLGVRAGRWDDYDRPLCAVEDCARPAHAQGFCASHGPRFRRHGDPVAGRRPVTGGSDVERFWTFVDRGNDCWLWTGARTTGGYAEFNVDGQTVYGHRWSHETFVGPIPDGYHVDHTCHNADPSCVGGNRCMHRGCVRPSHLEAVTPAENHRRAMAR